MLGRMEVDTLSHWNRLSPESAAQAILPCCGSQAWARTMARRRPIGTAAQLVEVAGEVWRGLPEADWQEAFESHPRIGEQPSAAATARAGSRSAAWSAEEQRSAAATDVGEQLALANRRYEERFGRVFLMCASGKSGPEILAALERRLGNDSATELRLAAEEQRRITELRLGRWLAEGAR